MLFENRLEASCYFVAFHCFEAEGKIHLIEGQEIKKMKKYI